MTQTIPKATKSKQSGEIRVIGGLWRGRKLPVVDVEGLRPTPNRLKEMLFNWLSTKLVDAHCLDLFCGSGSLGIEAASRGAAQVTLLDLNPVVAKQMQQNLHKIKSPKLQFLQKDVLAFLAKNPQAMDLIFIDPPFHQNILPQCLALIHQNGWLKVGGYLYIESESELHIDVLNIPSNWRLHKQKTS